MVGLVHEFRFWSPLRVEEGEKSETFVVFRVLGSVGSFWEVRLFGPSSCTTLPCIFMCGYEGETLFAIQQVFCDQRGVNHSPIGN